MNGLWQVLLLALLPGLGNFLGGLAAEYGPSSPRLLNLALHAASGIVIAIVAVELMPEAVAALDGWWIAAGFAAGAMAYLLIDSWVESRQEQGGGVGVSGMWMIYIAVAVDLASDGLMLGSGSALSLSLGLTLALGQVLADLPEGYAVIANFRAKGVPRARRLWLSASFILFSVGAAALAFLLLRNAPDMAKMLALTFVAGLLTVAAIEEMLTEAHEAEEDSQGSVVAFAGGFVLFTLVSAGIETMIGAG
ncbi:zinc transporter, ZIP family [Paracoccus halophilus]|uniref:Peptidoglycan-binding protein n=1 Tax=Paracoccus halophilus TaxID=376733 RepID=A0A099EVX3_9RHOB|nr:peptidoglycan-binding protein [Paracoccus halophilus]KGJ02073.1 peptidoglycan-binding protein [Paracoccus halophilus]SFA62021.1 zinc transporter, ZIP family [Paracoccus halophilus]